MWQVLIAVATGGEHIVDLEESYSKLRKEIDICVEAINAAGANFKVDAFFTLREWQTYWRKTSRATPAAGHSLLTGFPYLSISLNESFKKRILRPQ
jgi:hypothetical protein